MPYRNITYDHLDVWKGNLSFTYDLRKLGMAAGVLPVRIQTVGGGLGGEQCTGHLLPMSSQNSTAAQCLHSNGRN